jgi:5-methylcytosine-specific restriction endonuclease McrA
MEMPKTGCFAQWASGKKRQGAAAVQDARRLRVTYALREPALPAYPSNSFVRDQIELVGGVSGTPLSSGYQKKILERDGHKCQICGEVFPADQLEVHHIKPQAKGGRHYPANLVTLCWRCHRDETWFGHKHKMR